MVLILTARQSGEILDVRGAFLKGSFGNNETLYMHIAYSPTVPLKHGPTFEEDFLLAEASSTLFFIFLLSIAIELGYTRSKADPCLHYKWTDNGSLLLWMTWVSTVS